MPDEVVSEELAALKLELATKEAKLTELEATVKRVQADFENFVKRAEKTRLAESRAGQAALLLDLLSVLDSFDGAAKNAPSNPGLSLVREQFEKILRQYGVRPIVALHAPFDPSSMDVLAEGADTKLPPGLVLEVVSNGYTLHDALLRPARVILNNPAKVSMEKEKDNP